jgi:hypothetical protein
MPVIEVDEATLAAWPEMQRIWNIAGRISTDPKARELMQEAVLIAAPDAAGPEARIRKEIKERESAIEERLNKFLDAQAEEKKKAETEAARRALEKQWLDGRASARKAGYDGESLANLEKFMEDKGIVDHDVAISHFERLNPPPPPSITGGSRWNFFDQPAEAAPDMKRLYEQDYDGFLNQAIPAALREARGG